MDFFTISNGVPVRVSDQGKGDTIVLLHGYLETLEVWESFVPMLAKKFRVITLDLPGHGLSGWNGGVHTMEFMADTVKGVLDKLEIKEYLPIGHSMGGYVALAFAKKYPELTKGLCLFHSSPNPDTEEKKANRDREIELIRAGKLALIAQTAVPNTFAQQNVGRFQEVIWAIEELADVADEEGVIACLQGMKERDDMNDFLQSYEKPLLLIFGKSDNFIPWEAAEAFMAKLDKADSLVLENSGHIGFIEEPELSAAGILVFAEKVFSLK